MWHSVRAGPHSAELIPLCDVLRNSGTANSLPGICYGRRVMPGRYGGLTLLLAMAISPILNNVATVTVLAS